MQPAWSRPAALRSPGGPQVRLERPGDNEAIVKIIDRYVIREFLPPFAIALAVLTFVLLVPFLIEQAEQFIQKGVAWSTILEAMATLLPATLGLTIPMALLVAILMAFGRLSADRETIVLMACGVSPYRLLRPILFVSTIAAAATLWIMIKAIPDANQAYREIIARVGAEIAEEQVRPRTFFESFPNLVLYVRDTAPGGGWADLLAADTRNPAHPVIFVASSGRMIVDRQARTIQMLLRDGAQHTTSPDNPAVYEIVRFDEMVLALDPETVFPRVGPARGEREMTIAELKARIAELRQHGLPVHNPIIEIHKKFSLPVACLVFAVLGVALGLSSRRDGKMASFVVGLGVIFTYYVLMFGAHAMAKGAWIPAWSAMWIPNVILGAAGIALLVARARGVDLTFRLRLPAWPLPGRSPAARAGLPGSSSMLSAPPATRRPRVVLVVRLPHLSLPRPPLLDLYVTRTYLRMLGLCSAGLLGLFYISTFLDRSDKLFKGEVTLGMLLEYLWWETPQFFYYVLAIAVLLSAIITIGLLTKHSEIVVMRACGISLYRTALPLLVFAALASALLFAFEERVLAVSNRRADYLNHIIRGGNPQTFDVINRKWLAGPGGEIYHYQHFDPARSELHMLSVLRFLPGTHALGERIFAARASYAPRDDEDTDPWVASNGWVRQLNGAAVRRYAPFEQARVPLPAASYFRTEAPEPDRMTARELRAYIDELKASGYAVLEYEVALHRKFAFPLVTLVMTLIAVPFAVTTGKRGALYGIGLGIALALVYWTAISVFAALGASGVLPPALAAWAPNLLFGAAAAFLLLTVRT